MLTVLLVIQIIICVSMVSVILVQKTSSDGVTAFGGGGNSLFSGKSAANILTRTTAILAFCFMLNSLAMASITSHKSVISDKIIEDEKKSLDKVAPKTNEEPTVPIAK